jgi:excisionase family DNA binding protein
MYLQQTAIQTSIASVIESRPLSVHRVSEILNVSERTVRYWASTGRLQATRIGKKLWKFQRSDVIAFKRRSEAPYA